MIEGRESERERGRQRMSWGRESEREGEREIVCERVSKLKQGTIIISVICKI